MDDTPALELAEISASSGSLSERAGRMLERLRRITPFDAAWVALTDPVDGRYRSLLAVDLDDSTHRYLSGPKMAADIETTETDQQRPPLSPSDLPYPAAELATWAECLLPTGFHQALAAGLFTADSRHVGFLALLSESRRPPTSTVRHRLHRLTPLFASGIDPLRSLTVSARVLADAEAGVALCVDGSLRPLPGLTGDDLLSEGSPIVDLAGAHLVAGQALTSFLWPRGDRHAPDGHVRVTALARPPGAPQGLLGAVLLDAAPDVRGLTPRELEVLGLLIEGRSNHQIARTLYVTPRTVATHLEHISTKLDAQTRTLAAVRAQRWGLYVPPLPGR